MIYIGIDPGKHGAMAAIWDGEGEGWCIEITPFSTDGYREALAGLPGADCVCCLERVGPMPKQGVTSMFKFGENYGGLLQHKRMQGA